MAEMHNPSPDRPIRYLWWNVPAAVLEGLVASDATHVTDGEFKSDEITDYDAAIVFLDSWSQISDFQYTKEFGINEDDVRGTEDTKLVYTAEVYFQGKASKFNVFLFNKANFMDRDQNCYGKLLLEIMLLYASGSPSGRLPLEEFKVCKEEPK